MRRKVARATTLNDVARDAGCSYQTVSRVINDHPHVSESTRARVAASILKLGYRPNPIARGLVTRRSNAIGIAVFGSSYYGPSQMVVNIERSLREWGYGLTITTLPDMTFESLRNALEGLRGRMVEGMVLITPISGVDLERIEALCAGTPVVLVDAGQAGSASSVVIDQRAGGRLATRHLIDLGHERIASISGPLAWNDARLRREGWLEALACAGLEPGPEIESDWTAAGGRRALHGLLEHHAPPDAIVVGNDQMALGVLRGLRERGVAVPREVSIVGFDDVPEAAFFEPPLTTVRQDFTSLGQQSAECLVQLIKDRSKPPMQRTLPPRLIVRESTAVAESRGGR